MKIVKITFVDSGEYKYFVIDDVGCDFLLNDLIHNGYIVVEVISDV